MSSFPQDPCVYSDKPPLCCCIGCRMSLWRRHAEAVLSVCVHLSAPYIFWVGWIAVREKLCGLLVWLTDVKAKAALTIAAVAWACSMFLSKACCAPSWSSQHEGHPNCLVSSSPFVLDWCVHVYVLPYLCVCVYLYGDLMFVQCFHCPHWNSVQLDRPSLLSFGCCWEEKENLALLVLARLWWILRWSVLFQKPEPLINVICWNWSSCPVSSPG